MGSNSVHAPAPSKMPHSPAAQREYSDLGADAERRHGAQSRDHDPTSRGPAV